MISVLLAASLVLGVDTSVQFGVSHGLTVNIHGAPFVQGSVIQVYEEGWKRGIFSTKWDGAAADTRDGYWKAVSTGEEGLLRIQRQHTKTAGGVRSDYEIRWDGEETVFLEVCLGYLNGPMLEEAGITLDDEQYTLSRQLLEGGLAEREIGTGFQRGLIAAPIGRMDLEVSGIEAHIYDSRGMDSSWAAGKEVLWFGNTGVEAAPGTPVKFGVEWRFYPEALLEPQDIDLEVATTPVESVVTMEDPLPLIPRPKESTLDYDKFLRVGLWDDPTGEAGWMVENFLPRAFFSRWEKDLGARLKVDGAVADLGLPGGGYVLEISEEMVSIKGQDVEGIRNACSALSGLMYPRDGRLVLPIGTIRDWPSLAWRGVHLFGKSGWLLSNLLVPLRFNAAVIQCERTDWKAAPGLTDSRTMTREEAETLFMFFRAFLVEPVPLIQSLGHTEWLFANGKNRHLAVNPDQPYTLDPRKPGAKELIRDIWLEAKELFKPDMIHFGLDEVNMRGMTKDPAEATELWQQMTPHLRQIAEDLHATPMLWGDMMLEPGTAPDAMNGGTGFDATMRRLAWKDSDAWIADWHYKAEPNPEAYKSIDLLHGRGFETVPSSWYQPDNIRGQTLAAIEKGSKGVLQTTWAGYTTTREAIEKNPSQFAAYVLAGDYAWSGREELPSELPYDPYEVLRRLLFMPQEHYAPIAGLDLELPQVPFIMRSTLTTAGREGPTKLAFDDVSFDAYEVVVQADAAQWAPEGTVLAEMTIHGEHESSDTMEIKYGVHVRAPRDKRPILASYRSNGISEVRQQRSHASCDITAITIEAKNPASSVRIYSIAVAE
jgi:hypothetical protein